MILSGFGANECMAQLRLTFPVGTLPSDVGGHGVAARARRGIIHADPFARV
jgi:hypothetical protein